MVVRVSGQSRVVGTSASSSIMRRSGSNSCLLNPKGGVAPQQQQQQQQPPAENNENGENGGGEESAAAAAAAADIVEPLSVTLLSTEQLPRYSTERFYMLSELEQHSDSLLFLSSLSRGTEDSTQDTEEMSIMEDEDNNSANGDDHHHHHHHSNGAGTSHGQSLPDFPYYCILYLLWKPEMTTNAQVFVETTILESVNRLESLVHIVGVSSDYSSLRQQQQQQHLLTSLSTASSSYEELEEETQAHTSSTQQNSTRAGSSSEAQIQPAAVNSTTNGPATSTSFTGTPTGSSPTIATSLYIVVDRVDPAPAVGDATDNHQQHHHQQQEVLAQQLAKHVAMHPKLRRLCNGVTVGVSNHERAAPGLEACVDAVLIGSANRRNFGDGASKSLIGLIAPHRDCMLGLNLLAATDAAQGVHQSRVVAEWNARGNLQSFAKRAHANWRQRRGLPPQLEQIRRRKIPRRIHHHQHHNNNNNNTPRPPKSPPPDLQKHAKFPQQGAGLTSRYDTEELVYDCLAAVWIALYLLLHFRNEFPGLFWFLDSSAVEDFVQDMREWGH